MKLKNGNVLICGLGVWRGCKKQKECYREEGHAGKCGLISNQLNVPREKKQRNPR